MFEKVKIMKNKKFVLLFLFMAALILTACGNTQEGPLSGKYAYIHDTEKAALVFRGDKVTLDGTKYSYTVDGEFVLLTRNGKTTPMRFLETKDGMYIYKTTVYTLTNGDVGKGILGKWDNAENKWSFEFNDKAEFLEDGIFAGHYFNDEEAGTFKLMYNDPVEDTVCYYTVDGETLTVEYPWPMVKMAK